VQSRFQPGRSGNPSGRPKGSRKTRAASPHKENRLESIILNEAYRDVAVNDGRRQVTIPMAQAIVRSLAVNAAKGNQRAQRLFTALVTTTERERKKARESELEAAIVYKVRWEQELQRRRRVGIVAPDPLPHPDHVVIDVADGTVFLKGPATKEEQALWKIWSEQQTIFEKDVRELNAYLDNPEAAEREDAIEDLQKLTTCLEVIRAALNGSRSALRFLQSVAEKGEHQVGAV
jgi:hypothetical protein